jgi:hypothetical protein
MIFASENREGLGETLDVQRRAPVGTDAERILTSDLQEIGHQVELAADLEVLHGPGAA